MGGFTVNAALAAPAKQKKTENAKIFGKKLLRKTKPLSFVIFYCEYTMYLTYLENPALVVWAR
jgi:hypothetical protein